MFNWNQNKDRIQRLKEKYTRLMKRAYEIAPRNKKKSDYLNSEAKQILQELRILEINQLH
ncbi:Lacal_2735 family protein [Mesonia aestuariivivens]|uniref:Lacal_2735 family protein n=1 Tax=Mesonia aestuariivivens TaxID=2796128 RepID=A0ABS6VZS8_9FLAO|nr:Lacal_2735 family protein [Mesonia aestuariivivens]MBW2961009.1 Lacal_2735 family protein [Mesonia aestuariivivens]